MSSKTIKQRIALVAATALTAGVLSVVSAPVANAAAHAARTDLACGATTTSSITLNWTAPTGAGALAQVSAEYSTDGGLTYLAMPDTTTAGTGVIIRQSGANTPLADGVAYSISIKTINNEPLTSAASNTVSCMVQAGVLHIGTTDSTTGSVVATATYANQRSLGWVTKTSTNGTSHNSGLTLVGGIAGTGVVLAGGKIPFVAVGSTTSGTGVGLTVTGGKIDTVACANGTASLNGTGTVVACVSGNGTAAILSGVLNVSAATGSTASISAYRGINVDDYLSPTNGALMGTWSLTVASASASGTYSASDSSIYVQPGIAVGGTSSTVQAYDTASALDNGTVGVIWVQTKDAYTSAVTGQLNASSTAGNVVITNSTVAATESYSGTSTFDNEASFDGDGYITVRQPTANTASTSVVTITLDGAVIATKTIKWNGIAASVSLVAASSSSIFKNGYSAWTSGTDTTILNVVYSVKDAAGNAISVADAATYLSISDQTGSMVGASLSQTDVSGTAAAATIDAILQTTSLGYGVATMLIPSSSLNGAGTYMLKYVNGAGTSIKSAAINATVSSGAATYSASWDKASYATGDIATLTITAKDSKGNLIADGVVLGSGALVTTNSDGLASVTSACDAANIATTTYSAGSKVCKFAVKNAAGSYSYTAIVPTSTSQAATTGTVKITDASGSVSNADVLKSIVALIASINKQIQALQKLILARR